MAKVDVDIVKMVLERNELDVRTLSKVLEDIQSVLKEEELAKDDKPPPIKKQFVILVSDPKGVLEGSDLTGWVLQIPEEDPVQAVADRIVQSAYEFNVTPKGRRLPVETIGEACEVLPPRITKEHRVWIKTKEPVLVVTTDNEIPLNLPGTKDNASEADEF